MSTADFFRSRLNAMAGCVVMELGYTVGLTGQPQAVIGGYTHLELWVFRSEIWFVQKSR